MLPMGGIMGGPDAFDALIDKQHGGNLHAYVQVFFNRYINITHCKKLEKGFKQGLL